MSGYDRMVGAAGRLVGVRYPDLRDEVVATARSAGRDRGAAARAAELASLVALALRPARPPASARTAWAQGGLLGAVLGTAALVAPAQPLAIVLPFVLLALGVLDARLAAAATVFWLTRLLTIDARDVLGAIGDVALTAELLRWTLMLTGVALAAHVTQRSLRRAASL